MCWKLFLSWSMVLFLATNGMCFDSSSPRPWQAPTIENEHINKTLHSPQTVWYKATELFFHGGGFKTKHGQLGPDGLAKPDNGNEEFPWAHPGGTDNCPDTTTLKGIWMPEGTKIQHHHRQPVTISNGYSNGVRRLVRSSDTQPLWTYPEGTVFFELLYYKAICFEVRVRIKTSPKHGVDSWNIELFRPYPTAKDLLSVLPEDDPTAIHLRTKGVIRNQRLVSDGHPAEKGFDVTADVDVLPATNVDLMELLNVKFKDAKGQRWRDNCFAPTTRSAGHIVPPNYTGNFAGTDEQSCTNCHRHTARHVSLFNPQRDWYGHVRGSDGIFSFPISIGPTYRDATRNTTYKLRESIK